MIFANNLMRVFCNYRTHDSCKNYLTKLNRLFSTQINKQLSIEIKKTKNLLEINSLSGRINSKNKFDWQKTRSFSTSILKLNIKKNYDRRAFGQQKSDNFSKNVVWYTLSGLIIMGGLSYAFVPLFKMFCESQGMDANTDFRDMNIEVNNNNNYLYFYYNLIIIFIIIIIIIIF
jgi:hypothetical protein